MMVHNLRNGDIHLMVVVIVFLENSKISESCTSQPFLHPTISRALFPGAGWNAFKTSAPVCYSSSLGCLKATKTCPQGSPWNGEQMWELCRRGMWDRQCIVETFEIQNNDTTGKHILIITALRGRKWFWFQVTLNKSLSLGSKKGVIWKLPWYFMKFVNILFCTTGQKSKLVTA